MMRRNETAERDPELYDRPTQPHAAPAPMLAQARRTDEYPASAAAQGVLEESPYDGDLLGRSEMLRLQAAWDEIQSAFIDDPQGSVARADRLVGHVSQQVEAALASRRADLENHWSRGEQPSTEQLRTVLQRYRAFFQRLLAVQPGG